MPLNSDEERFRSFAERYVIERAHTFRAGFEEQDCHSAIIAARAMYGMIASTASVAYGTQDVQGQQPAGQGSSAYHSGVVGRPVPRNRHKTGGHVTQQMVADALAAVPDAPKKGAMLKLRAAVARLGGRVKV